MLGPTRVALLVTALAVGGDQAGPRDDMVLVPAGPAVLGGNGHAKMPGPSTFYLDDFWIDRFEVTNAAYGTFVEATGREPAAFADDPLLNMPAQPVTGVTWDDADAFCSWRKARLPSEIEWEKAARGVDARPYPWGEREEPARAHLAGKAPLPVDSHPGDISPYGVRGMAGNVAEWVEDQFVAGLHCSSGICPPPSELTFRAYLRGGHWDGLPHMARADMRLWDYPDTVAEFFGFRCARAAS